MEPAGGTAGGPRATGTAQLPFGKGFILGPLLALAASCHAELAAGKRSAPFCASGGSSAPWGCTALFRRRNLFPKADRETDFRRGSRHFPSKSVLPGYLAVSRPFAHSFLLAWVGPPGPRSGHRADAPRRWGCSLPCSGSSSCERCSGSSSSPVPTSCLLYLRAELSLSKRGAEHFKAVPFLTKLLLQPAHHVKQRWHFTCAVYLIK